MNLTYIVLCYIVWPGVFLSTENHLLKHRCSDVFLLLIDWMCLFIMHTYTAHAKSFFFLDVDHMIVFIAKKIMIIIPNIDLFSPFKNHGILFCFAQACTQLPNYLCMIKTGLNVRKLYLIVSKHQTASCILQLLLVGTRMGNFPFPLKHTIPVASSLKEKKTRDSLCIFVHFLPVWPMPSLFRLTWIIALTLQELCWFIHKFLLRNFITLAMQYYTSNDIYYYKQVL